MEASNYNKQAIKAIVLSCKHSIRATSEAIRGYITNHNCVHGEFSVGNMDLLVVLEYHYDEETADIIDDDWLTTVSVNIDKDVVNVTFD